MDGYSVAGILLLVACLGLVIFVAAAEAGLISISRARVRLMAGQGVPRADVLHDYIQEREALLQALALARIVAIVAPAVIVAAMVTRDNGDSLPLLGAIIFGALVLVVILEALPRALVVRNPERWGLRLLPFIGLFKFLFGGLARILNLPLRALARRPMEEDEAELMRLIELEDNEGDLEEDERKMIRGVFGLEGTAVREIMTPRIDIAAVDTESTPEDVLKLIIDRGFSRIPLYEKNADTIVGIIYAKDLIKYLAENTLPTRLTDIARTPFFIPESKRVDDLLTDMRKQRVHMAIVVDEYGGTAGLVTFEDLLEEIVGEIEDEYDPNEQQIVVISDNEAIIDGRVGIDELSDLFHVSIEAEEFDTVGGCVFHLLGRMPVVGDEAETNGLHFSVLSVSGHRVGRVQVTLQERPPEGKNGGNGNGNGHRENSPA